MKDTKLLRPASRTFHWISSVKGDPEALKSLHEAMMTFYAEEQERSSYQEMLDGIDNLPEDDSSTSVLARHIFDREPETVVEVGCAGGRLYRTLRHCGYEKGYTGLEVADYVIESNREKYADANWLQAEAYDLPIADEYADVICSEFVLEHLVFPEKALREMMRAVRPGGELLLFFPDFVESGRLSSQILGFSPYRTAVSSFKNEGLLDAVTSLYDSRIRLPKQLKNVRQDVGPFPINLRPACLTHPNLMFPDIDAVYIASKNEVREWAEKQGYRVNFPEGTTPPYNETAFLSIQKVYM